MSLLDDLRSVLTRHHQHVTSQTNQGTAHLIEAHLKALETAAGDADAHTVLDHLYGGLNAPATVVIGEHGPELAVPQKTATTKPKAAKAAPTETTAA